MRANNSHYAPSNNSIESVVFTQGTSLKRSPDADDKQTDCVSMCYVLFSFYFSGLYIPVHVPPCTHRIPDVCK